jgi:hypothetical protein
MGMGVFRLQVVRMMWLISNKKDGINVRLLPMCYLKNKKALQSFDNQITIGLL